MNTRIIWNTDIPKYNDVNENRILIKWKNDSKEEITVFDTDTDKTYSITKKQFDLWFGKNFIAYAVLTDEQEFCEWEGRENYFRSGCGCIFEKAHAFCPYCGLPIHIVDELKPLPLMGVDPKKITTGGITQFELLTETGYIKTLPQTTDREAIESWNKLVNDLTKKQTGEK